MTGTVTLTAAMRANLLSLQGTATLMGSTQQRLATGNKVNSALDNPSSFFAAQSLTNRADDLSSLLDGMAQSVQALKAADQGITGLTSLVSQAKAVANSARAEATGGAQATGTFSFTAAKQADAVTAGPFGIGTFTIQHADATGAAAQGPLTTISVTAGESLQSIVNDLNTVTGVSASLVAHTATGHAGEVFLQVRTTDGTGLQIIEDAGSLVAAAFGATVVTALAATNVTPPDRVALESQYTSLLTQIDNMVKDTGYAGKNLLGGDTMTVQFNEGNTTSVTVNGTKRDSAGLGMLAADFSTTGNIDTNLAQIATALTNLRTDATNYGNNLAVIQARSDFTTNLVGTLKDGATQLTIADKNLEGANLLSLQTSQQLGIQALSLASQSNQAVLRLFQ